MLNRPAWDLQQSDDLMTIRTPTVRVALRLVGDRWVHEIAPVDAPPLLASIESGTDDDPARVVSPVYQEVQHHAFDDDERRIRLLLTGLNHRHHFSAVLTVAVDDHGATTIEFDVADRCRDAVSSLAATYEVLLGVGDLSDAADHQVRWTGPTGSLVLRSSDGSRIVLADKGPRATQSQILAPLAAEGFTHRLRYGWTWASASDRTR